MGPRPKRRACKGSTCKAHVVDAQSLKTQKTIPLDARRHPIYVVWPVPGGPTVCEPIVDVLARAGLKGVEVLVSHFVTCPDVAEFTGGGGSNGKAEGDPD